MSYLHINNLYKEKDILMFKEVYALEKIHGSSAHISYDGTNIHYFSGGEKHDRFIQIFNQLELEEKVRGLPSFTVFGEVYGGKCQGMSKTYGTDLKFVAFDVKVGDWWLSVPQAHEFANSLGLEFVDYVLIPTDLDSINFERDKDSVQAMRNGMGTGHKSEGVVLRPPIELTKNNGSRIICKHKRDDFRETKTPRIVDEATLKVLGDAKAIADEWVTLTRLSHVLDKIPDHSISMMPIIIKAMLEDIQREAEGEIVWSKEAQKQISRATAVLVKEFYQQSLIESQIKKD